MKRSIVLFYLLAFLSAFAIAQGNGAESDRDNAPAPTPAAPTKTELPTLKTPDAEEDGKKETTTKKEEPTKTTENTKETEKPKETTQAPPKITGSGEAAGDDKDLPSASTTTKPAATIIGGGTPADSDGGLTKGALPTLIASIPKYPPPAVPNTNGAPFMQRSDLPEGTVFIAVGSALAFMALCIFVWRGIVAWALHRSVQKASRAPGLIESKGGRAPVALNKPSHASFYSAAPAGSTLSLNPLNPATGRKGSTSMPMTSPGRNNSSLFFSPTAAPNGSMPGNDQRRSAYLPAGYYPTATPPVPSIPPGPHHFHSASISSSNIGRFRDPSPPASPMLAPERLPTPGRTSVHERGSVYGGQGLRPAESHTSLSLPPQGRAPSAYLEDLFEGNILDHPQASQGGSYNRR